MSIPHQNNFGLFDCYGIEIEYMIVNREDLNVLPIADFLLRDSEGHVHNEIQKNGLSWSNELAAHVLEIKNQSPAPSLTGLDVEYHQSVMKALDELERYDGTILPGPAHPWMIPDRESKLWSHGQQDIYNAYDRIFDCRGHGWTNLQSVHINLPFKNDEEFGRLHAAIRIALPLIPALTAASPFLEGKITDYRDVRLHFYGENQKRIPSICNGIIPENIFSIMDYHEKILSRIYADIRSHDPDNILQEEWLNSRGAIARFERNAIEIRVMDSQESPLADLGAVGWIVALIRALVFEEWISYDDQKRVSSDLLKLVLEQTIRHGSDGILQERDFLKLFNISKKSMTAHSLWLELSERLNPENEIAAKQFMSVFESGGDLAGRILSHMANETTPSHETLKETYDKLIHTLKNNTFLVKDR